MPDTQVLTDAVLMFQQASRGWAEAMRPFMEDLLFRLIELQWVLLGLGYVFRIDPAVLFDAMFRFLLGNGFALFMVRFGADFIERWFAGVKRLAYFLGSPPLDPSAVAAHGWTVTDRIAKSSAEQGFLSFAFSPVSWIGFGAMLSMLIAFFILALILVSLLVASYFLTAACPWFFAWWGLSFTRGITLGYIRLVFGTMNGLFCVMLMVAVVSELAAQMEVRLRTQFLNPGITLTWQDYVVPLAVGVILCGLFVWLPYAWTRAMDGILLDWAGGRMLGGWGVALASGGKRMFKGGNQQGRGDGGNAPGGGDGAGSGGGSQLPPGSRGQGQQQVSGSQSRAPQSEPQQPRRSGNWGRGSGTSGTHP